MKLRWSTKTKITKDEIGENETNLEVTEVTLVHCTLYCQQWLPTRSKNLEYIRSK